MPETDMTKEGGDSGTISWRLFNEMYENQYDFFRKLRFCINAGKTNNAEAQALEMIEDLIGRKEAELEKIRQDGLREWSAAPGR
jgi:hypothetical protein